MDLSLDNLRRRATRLKKAYAAGETQAVIRVRQRAPRPEGEALSHADFLHVIAHEQGFASWPRLKQEVELCGMDHAAKLQRLKIAVYNGHAEVANRLLEEDPTLPEGAFGLQIALYDVAAVQAALDTDPGAATREVAMRVPMMHLALSHYVHARPDSSGAMVDMAELLLAHGADVDASMPVAPDNDHPLSALYGAIGHANNMALAQWLLDHGADPNDSESLYHSTELGHHEGLRMLLAAGADPTGTNALLRAMDFEDVEAVRLLLAHGAQVDDFNGAHVGGEEPWVVPALQQAARRMSGREMITTLLEAGADPRQRFQGADAYAWARVFGNRVLAQEIEARGLASKLSGEEALLAAAAEGSVPDGAQLDPEKLSKEFRNIIRMIVHLPGKLDHVKRLVGIGIEFDHPDSEGLTPVQIAGWEGLPDVMAYLLSLGPDLTHVNGYGGTLLSTILHGAENCPQRAGRDYVTCARLALDAGVALPRRAPEQTGHEALSAFLAEWAEAHPEQVSDG